MTHPTGPFRPEDPSPPRDAASSPASRGALSPCAWREYLMNGAVQFRCVHPRVHAEGNLVDSEICQLCRYRNVIGPRGETMPVGATGDAAARQWRWAVGVTTAPRQTPTLARCLSSVLNAGWSDVRLFVEPGSDLPNIEPPPAMTVRDQRLGAFPNWYLGLSELVMRDPSADAYFMLQDDSILATGLRAYLEHKLWPGPAAGVVSVYCPSHYSRDLSPGFHALHQGWNVWGAQSYVFPNQAARHLLNAPRVLEHRRSGPSQGLRNIDSVVGRWCQESGWDYFVHVPSLAQHVGDSSTLYPHAVAAGPRSASDFVPDVRQIPHG